jgi:hypothetical protein
MRDEEEKLMANVPGWEVWLSMYFDYFYPEQMKQFYFLFRLESGMDNQFTKHLIKILLLGHNSLSTTVMLHIGISWRKLMKSKFKFSFLFLM